MKKTLTVNLGGMVFQIDEDAYILLDNYLNNLRFHFRKEEGGDEIVSDMEMRISELFSEGIEGGQKVITIDNVEAVIARMGRPEQLGDEDKSNFSEDKQYGEETGEDSSYGEHSSFSSGTKESRGDARNGSAYEEVKPTKRLFRDVDNRILGGVLSGIAAYFGWDRTALRILVIVLGLMPHAILGFPMLIVYFVLQFIIPPARTATEKLQMRGEPVNMGNIGKTVTDSFEQEKNANDDRLKRSGFHRFLDVLVSIFGILLKIFLGFMAILCIPVIFSGIVALFSIMMAALGIVIHIPSICFHMMPHLPWDAISDTPILGTFFILSGLLMVGIPLFSISQVIFQHCGYWKAMSPGVKISLLAIWFIAIVVAFMTFFMLQC